MILPWMLVAAAVGVAAGLGALAAQNAARALGRSTRFAWLGALLFSTVWPAWLAARAALPPREAAATGTVILPTVLVAAGDRAMSRIGPHLPIIGPRASQALLVCWLVLTLVLLLRLGHGAWAVHRQRRSWTPREIGGLPVLVAPATGPAVVGIARSAIVVPEWALALDATLQRLVLRHEVEHVRAHDTLLRLAGAVATALVPWNPALWWQADRLALAIEVDCDARVLQAEPRRERYGLLLLAIAQRQVGVMLAPALSEATSHLERRIVAMQSARPRRPTLVAAGSSTAAAIALIVACSAPSPSAPASTARAAGSASTAPAAGGTAVARAAVGGAADAQNAPQAGDHRPTYTDSQVDEQARPMPGNPQPRFPADLQKAHVSGKLLLQFVIDANGRVDMSTFKVVHSDNDEFVQAVRAVLPQARFYPATVAGRPVREMVTTPYVFAFRS